MARLRSNNVFGTTTNNPLASGDLTLNAAGLANLTAVTGSDYAVIILDPNRVNGAPEIVYVTAHTGSATSATITRGQEGTSARSHPSGTFWVHGASAIDLRPFSPPACAVYHDTTQSCADAAETLIVFNSERYDTDSMHSTVSATSKITFTTAGLYLITFRATLPGLTTYSRVYSSLRVDGSTLIGYAGETPTTFNAGPLLLNTAVYKAAAGSYVEALVYQDNTANTAQNLQSGANFSPEFTATWLGEG